jgi:peptidylprolyl isomerase
MRLRRFVFMMMALPVVLAGCAERHTHDDGHDHGPAPTTTTTAKFTELGIEDLQVGESEDVAEKGDTAYVTYVGTLTNGKQFDSNKGRDPFTFRIGYGEVIRGWDEGVVGMRPGGRRKLQVPSEMAYGQGGAGADIPPNADLLFEVELHDLVKAGEANAWWKEDLKPGEGREAREGDQVSVHYVMRLVNGRQIESTRDGEPVSFKIGGGQAASGFEAGLVGMRPGGVRKLRIGPGITEGMGLDRGAPMGSILLFEVEMLKVTPGR